MPALVVIVFSVDIAVCLVLLVLFSIITVKSHCCDRQYSRKQRIFLYLLLPSLGASCTGLIIWSGNQKLFVWNGVYWGLLQLVDVTFCWAALHMCSEVYTTLRRTDFHCLRFRFRTIVEEVCILIVVITISAGCAVEVVFFDFGTTMSYAVIVYSIPLTILALVDIVSIILVLVQLCVACRRVESGQVTNGLRRPAVATVTLLVFLVVHVVAYGVLVSTLIDDDIDTWFLLTVYILGYKVIPYAFVIFFGWKMLLDLGRQCCFRRYRRPREYGQIPGQGERVVFSVQSTTQTYNTCDDAGTTRTYYTCDESQPSEWFRVVPAPDPPVH